MRRNPALRCLLRAQLALLGVLLWCCSVAVAQAASPRITQVPAISGPAQIGAVLTATAGTWTPADATATYQWLRCDPSGKNCADIAGATTPTSYKVATDDQDHTLRIRLTVTIKAAKDPEEQSDPQAQAQSDPTAVVPRPPAPQPPSNTQRPQLTGTARQGQVLTASPGQWSGASPLSYAYQWERCGPNGNGCGPIVNAIGVSYTLSPDDVGRTVRVAVTASNADGTSQPARSTVTAVILPATVAAPPPPTGGVAGQAFSQTSSSPAPVQQPGSTRPPLMTPFPVVRVRGIATSSGAVVRLLTVTAPRGARVAVTCSGAGCRQRSVAQQARVVRIRSLERALPAGTRIVIRVTRAGVIGKYTSLVIRVGRAPLRRDRCLMPGGTRPVACPAA